MTSEVLGTVADKVVGEAGAGCEALWSRASQVRAGLERAALGPEGARAAWRGLLAALTEQGRLAQELAVGQRTLESFARLTVLLLALDMGGFLGRQAGGLLALLLTPAALCLGSLLLLPGLYLAYAGSQALSVSERNQLVTAVALLCGVLNGAALREVEVMSAVPEAVTGVVWLALAQAAGSVLHVDSSTDLGKRAGDEEDREAVLGILVGARAALVILLNLLLGRFTTAMLVHQVVLTGVYAAWLQLYWAERTGPGLGGAVSSQLGKALLQVALFVPNLVVSRLVAPLFAAQQG